MTSNNFQRRSLLKAGVLLGIENIINPKIAFASSSSLIYLDATEQAKLIKTREISPLELVMSAIERIESLNPYLNAVVTNSFEQAISIAKTAPIDGPFSGVPYLIKDLLNQKGVRTSSGSRMFGNRIAKKTSSNVQAALDMGLISLGKTNTPEFGLSGTTESLLLGPAKNPWNLFHSTGGSSGGSAAAVASGMVAIASASDGGGSIRVPASCCGVVGLKPSRHRTIDDAGQRGRPIHLSVRFVHTRTVRDTITALHHMQRTDLSGELPMIPDQMTPIQKKLKIALVTSNMLGKSTESDVENSIVTTAKLCEELGHQVENIKPFIDGERFVDSFLTLWAQGARSMIRIAEENFGRTQEVLNQLLEPWTLGLGHWFDGLPAGSVERATKRLQEDALKSSQIFKSYDVVLSPVTQTVTPKNGYLAPDVPYDELLEKMVNFITFTPLMNVTGDPAISLPLGWASNGLPIGSQFHSNIGTEQQLLKLALQLEEARPWKNKWPPGKE